MAIDWSIPNVLHRGSQLTDAEIAEGERIAQKHAAELAAHDAQLPVGTQWCSDESCYVCLARATFLNENGF